MSEPRITVEGLTKRYGSRVALAGVTFSVAAGEIVGLLGPNGAGKSTALSIIATLLSADAGTVTVGGHRLPADAPAVRRIAGLVPQQTAVYAPLTARENLQFFARMQGLGGAAATAATARALVLVGLESRADDSVSTFSGGMRRRLNLACGIVHGPSCILLDEPTVGVDPQSRERIFEATLGFARAGAAIVYCTHYMEEAERLCDRVVLLDEGRVVAAGTPAELVAHAGATGRLRVRTAGPLPAGWLEGMQGVRIIDRPRDGAGGSNGTFADTSVAAETDVAVDDTAAVPAVLTAVARAGAAVLELSLDRPNLADAFFHLTGRRLRDEDGTPAA